MGRPCRVPSNTSVPLLPYPRISGPISMRPTRLTPARATSRLCTHGKTASVDLPLVLPICTARQARNIDVQTCKIS